MIRDYRIFFRFYFEKNISYQDLRWDPKRIRQKARARISFSSHIVSNSPTPFARLFRDKTPGIYSRPRVFDAQRRLLAPREISFPFAPLPRNGTSLSRWSQSRVLRTSPRLRADPVVRESRRTFPLYSFPSCALFRPQSTCDIADSKTLPQTTFSLLSLRIDVDPDDGNVVVVVVILFVLLFVLFILVGVLLRLTVTVFLLKYCSIPSGNAIQNKLNCLASIVRSLRVWWRLKCSILFRKLVRARYICNTRVTVII